LWGRGEQSERERSDRHLGRHESWTTREGSKPPAPRLAAVAGKRLSASRSATVAARKRWRWKAMAPQDWEEDEGWSGGLEKKKRAAGVSTVQAPT
jgi:hypothetical protein